MLQVQPESTLGRYATLICRPLMKWLAGTWDEAPQETHRWNNMRLSHDEVSYLREASMVAAAGDPHAKPRWLKGIPLFHIPRFGGWRKYVTLGPKTYGGIWYVGWITDDAIGVSRIPTRGLVRVLAGPGPVRWFGVTEIGEQLPISYRGSSYIGDGGPYAQLPLR